jgi:hypothetical protein
MRFATSGEMVLCWDDRLRRIACHPNPRRANITGNRNMGRIVTVAFAGS